ncbi:MAG: hypothetical protein QGF00_03460 [Planctomycetota bacterium]|nr:hypothetical protein [Planctomycetota bacterium]MDP7248635.1 hypothetical protein [Planctomycetota bacterium]
MTPRGIILGLAGALFVCAYTYFNDWVLRQTHFIGNHMPVAVYGMLVFFLLFINSQLKQAALKGGEVAVALGLVLMVCVIPGSGLMRTFTFALMLPNHLNKLEPGWRKEQVLSNVPEGMLVNPGKDEDKILGSFLQGYSGSSGHIPVDDIPWSAWAKPLAFWVPLIFCMWLALMGLSLVLHRQWSAHEQLPYPIASYTNELMPTDGQTVSHIFTNRLFWISCGGVFLIHFNNYCFQWFPETFLRVPLQLDFGSLRAVAQTFLDGGGWMVLRPIIFFTVIGIAYFIPSDLSGAFGFGPYIWAFIAGSLVSYNISPNAPVIGTGYISPSPIMFIQFGAAIGVFLFVLYNGRHFYGCVCKAAFSGDKPGEVDDFAVWGLRVFLVAYACWAGQMILGGVDWILAIAFTSIIVVYAVVVSRIIAEAGLFHLQLVVFPCAILWGLFGRSLGATQLLILEMCTIIMIIDPRECFMPFLVNTLRLVELQGESLGRFCRYGALALLVGLFVALPVTIYIQYDLGAQAIPDSWAQRHVPRFPFNNVVKATERLTSQGSLEESESLSSLQRLRQMSPNRACVISLVIGIGLVIFCSGMRLRVSRWPVHPLAFLVCATWHIKHFAFSFIIGWAIKILVIKYGGAGTYNKVRPLMIGLIVGEVMGAIAPSLVGLIYFLLTDQQPPSFRVLPG